MSKFLFAVFSCMLFIGIGNGDVFASNTQKHTFEIAPTVSHIKYEEPGLMKTDGMMHGIRAAYTYRDRIMLGVEGRLAIGKVDYTGSVMDLTTGVKTPHTAGNIPQYMIESRGLVGYIFPMSKTSSITYFTGLGYRYLHNDLSVDPGGYLRESNYIYSPIGVRYDAKLRNGWSFGAEAEYNIFWRGMQISHFNHIDPGFNVLKNTQRDGHGLRASVEFAKKTGSVELALTPFIEHWNIGDSERVDLTFYGTKVGEAWEPKNRSTEIGLGLALKW